MKLFNIQHSFMNIIQRDNFQLTVNKLGEPDGMVFQTSKIVNTIHKPHRLTKTTLSNIPQSELYMVIMVETF